MILDKVIEQRFEKLELASENGSGQSTSTIEKPVKERSVRSIMKAISWRTVGTIDTIVISLLLTGEIKVACAIGSVEILTKMTLYFLHERLWNTIKWGKQ